MIRDEPLTAPAGFRAWRILYHSRSVTGADVPVSGFVVIANGPAPATGRPVLAYAHGVRGLASRCAPSNSIQPLSGLQNYVPMLRAGVAVVATDYAGLGAPGSHPYLVGESEARSVLDAVRAARQLPGIHLAGNVVVFGDTQGGQAALFTGQIAPTYAPGLHLLGVAAEDPPTDLLALERHAATTPFAVEFLLEAAAGYSAANPAADLRTILTHRGLTDLRLVRRECDDQFGQATAGQSVSSVFSESPLVTPPWSTGLAADSAGAVRIGAPILIVQGTADQLYPANIAASFVRHICTRGEAVDYRTYPQIGHAVTIAAARGIIAWITGRFASRPPPSTCH
jgi:pimeloyl-ACP methyl ester carboxylesterase